MTNNPDTKLSQDAGRSGRGTVRVAPCCRAVPDQLPAV